MGRGGWVVLQNIRMYRKYVLKRTHVINTHNYLLEAQQGENGSDCLFHQLLISSQSLPSLKDVPAIEQLIGQSENQNSVNEVPTGFEFYLEKNLLQIRLKQGVRPITDIGSLPIRQVLVLLNSLNVDFAISVKQMRSMARHNQSAYSNANKFFSMIAVREKRGELILPLIDGEQIQFYDLYYQEAFCNNREKEKERQKGEKGEDGAFKKKLSQKKIKRKSQMSEDPFYADEVVFRRYLLFLTSLFFHRNIVQFLQDLQKLGECPSSQALKRLEKMGNKAGDKTEKMLLELLFRCISCDSEYSLNIFIKQCEILIDKHDKLSQQGIPSEKKLNESRPIREDKLKTSKSCLALNKDLRAELSFTHNERPITRESEKRLKGAKSLINLKTNKAVPASKSRNLKNGSIFSKSKEKLNDKTNLFQQSWSNLNRQKGKLPGSSQSGNLMGSSAASNWFNQSLPNESLIKLRNFKKGNNFNPTASHTPVSTHNQFRSQASANLGNTAQENEVSREIEKISESQLGRLGRLIRKESVKAEKMAIIELDDKFTMTEQFEESTRQAKEEKQIETKELRKAALQQTVEPKEPKGEKSNKCFKREIVNTLNLKFGEQPKKKVEVRVEVEKKQEPKQPNAAEEPKTTPKVTNNTEIIKKEQLPKKDTQKLMPVQRKQATQVITKDLIKPKKVQAIKQPILDDQQFEQVTFTKKQAPKINQKAPQPMKNNSVFLQKQKQSKNAKIAKQVKQLQMPRSSKITVIALPQDQKKLYVQHFVHQINFYSQYSTKLKQLPQNNNQIYIMYQVYYRTLLENSTFGFEAYKGVIDILVKKQQRMNPGEKDACQLYKMVPDTLWPKGKTIRAIDDSLSKGIDQSILRERISQSKAIIQQFYNLTCQANRLLQQIIQELFKYIQKDKFKLISQGKFLIALQWAHIITFTMIISVQRENYYACMLREQFGKMADCFPFRYRKGVDEYSSEYRKRLEGLDQDAVGRLDVKQEFSYYKAQYERYK